MGICGPVWFNSISSKDGINVLLIESLLYQIKVKADGLAWGATPDTKGIISIHYFTRYNIPIINELQLLGHSESIMATPAGHIHHCEEQV